MKLEGTVDQIIDAVNKTIDIDSSPKITEIEIHWHGRSTNNWAVLQWIIARSSLEKITIIEDRNSPSSLDSLDAFILALASSLQHPSTKLCTSLTELDLSSVNRIIVEHHFSQFEYAFIHNTAMKAFRLPSNVRQRILQQYPKTFQLTQVPPPNPAAASPAVDARLASPWAHLVAPATLPQAVATRMPFSQRGTLNQILTALRLDQGKNNITRIFIEWDTTEDIKVLSPELLRLIISSPRLTSVAIIYPSITIPQDLIEIFHSFVTTICSQFPGHKCSTALLDLSEIKFFMNNDQRWSAMENSLRANPRSLKIILPKSLVSQDFLTPFPLLCERAGIKKITVADILSTPNVLPLGALESELSSEGEEELGSGDEEDQGRDEFIESFDDPLLLDALPADPEQNKRDLLSFLPKEIEVALARINGFKRAFVPNPESSLKSYYDQVFTAFGALFSVCQREFNEHSNDNGKMEILWDRVMSYVSHLANFLDVLEELFVIEEVRDETKDDFDITDVRLKSAVDSIGAHNVAVKADELINELVENGFHYIALYSANFITKTLFTIGIPVATIGIATNRSGISCGVLGLSTGVTNTHSATAAMPSSSAETGEMIRSRIEKLIESNPEASEQRPFGFAARIPDLVNVMKALISSKTIIGQVKIILDEPDAHSRELYEEFRTLLERHPLTMVIVSRARAHAKMLSVTTDSPILYCIMAALNNRVLHHLDIRCLSLDMVALKMLNMSATYPHHQQILQSIKFPRNCDLSNYPVLKALSSAAEREYKPFYIADKKEDSSLPADRTRPEQQQHLPEGTSRSSDSINSRKFKPLSYCERSLPEQIETHLIVIDTIKRAFDRIPETSLKPYYDQVFNAFGKTFTDFAIEYNANCHDQEKLRVLKAKVDMHFEHFDKFEKLLRQFFVIEADRHNDTYKILKLCLKPVTDVNSKNVEELANDLINAVEVKGFHGLAISIANFITKVLLAIGIPVAATVGGAYVGGVVGGILGLLTVTFTGPAGLIVGASLGTWIGGAAGCASGTGGGIYASSNATFFSPVHTSLTAFARQSVDYVKEVDTVERLRVAAPAA
jgi:hypothetical protein